MLGYEHLSCPSGGMGTLHRKKDLHKELCGASHSSAKKERRGMYPQWRLEDEDAELNLDRSLDKIHLVNGNVRHRNGDLCNLLDTICGDVSRVSLTCSGWE